MITVVIGTNANGSSTNAVANVYIDSLKKAGVAFQLCDLQTLPTDLIGSDMYHNRSEAFEKFQAKYLFPTEKYIIIVPEYNGGIPGIFKLMMDCSDITKAWWGKKACLTGCAAGRSGNLRGLDNLTNILNYLKVDVFKNKVPISKINEIVQDEKVADKATLEVLNQQLEEYLEY